MDLSTRLFNSSTEARLSDSFDYFLIEISGKIQVTQTQREKAETSYNAIADFLKNNATLLKQIPVTMTAIGGFGTNTATKPVKGDEFDLDSLAKLGITKNRLNVNAQTLFSTIYEPLNKSALYKEKIEVKDRCVRLHYSGDFYVDLNAAVLDDEASPNGKIWVPTRRNGVYSYELVNPIGLMTWFESRCQLEQTKLAKVLNEREAPFETMPLLTEEAKKPILKQAVQLIKRARDVYFADDNECKKILKSVVILTLAGQIYEGQRSDLYRLVLSVINSINTYTANLVFSKVLNPVNAEEDFLESLRKKPERYKKLRTFITDFHTQWSALLTTKDLKGKSEILEKLFGESVSKSVFSEYAERMSQGNRAGLTRMNVSGGVGLSASASSGVKIPRHQFYGDE